MPPRRPPGSHLYSDVIRSALEREIAGQRRAVNSVVRGVTRAVGGLVPREGPLCAYMFMGPTGTGKTHLVRTLAQTLHGDERGLVVADCTHFAQGDPWLAFVRQLAPLFVVPRMGSKWAVLDTPPLSIILVEYLERGRPEVAKALTAALETGHLTLPEGRQGSLRNCLVFITSSLCSREILEQGPGIGFAGSQGEEAEDNLQRLYKLCSSAAQEQFGGDLLGRLDGLITFDRLQEDHLSEILDRLVRAMNGWLARRGFCCELLSESRAFLLERGRADLRLGARDLVRAHRRFVEFPVADLLISGRIPTGARVLVDRKPGEEHLHFTVECGRPEPSSTASDDAPREIPVAWDDDFPVAVH